MTTVQEAKDVLGESNVFGADEWFKFFGKKFQLANIPEIPWSASQLKNPGIDA
jgi:hypothetical protein